MHARLTYFAYGSNLHPRRLRERVSSCRFVELAELTGYTLRFHKRGADGSGKCNAFYTGDATDRVIGALYELPAGDKRHLDAHEGEGYEARFHTLTVSGQIRDVFTYLALPDYIDESLRPYLWYKELVVLGAAFHSFPGAYVERLVQINTIADPDRLRHNRHAALIQRLRD